MTPNTIVKSASKHYSPLRYPGGKASLSLFLASLLRENKISECYVEPYAGGSGAALTLLMLEKVDTIIINDLDRAIYSFWKSILNSTDEFIDKIKKTRVNLHEWYRQREIYRNKNSNQFDLGFATFFLNRTNRSGIIEGGPIGGVKQNGKWLINARFNKENLIERITNIASYRSRICVKNYDGIDLMKKVYKEREFFIYLDPPYFVKGSSLYLNHYLKSNHQQLACFLNKNSKANWVLTYDNVSEIRELYEGRKIIDFKLHYFCDLPKMGKEILVISDSIDCSFLELNLH